MNSFLQRLGIRRVKKPTRKIDGADQSAGKRQPSPGNPKDAVADHPDEPKFKWKFVDANAFIRQGILKLVEVEDFQKLDFVAISYTWSKNILEWRKWILSLGPEEKANRIPSDSEASEDMKKFHLFFTVVSFLVLARGKSFFWIDLLSINQDAPAEKAFFVPKMGLLYAGSFEAHAYVTGSALIAMSSDELHLPIWETRAWTLQEYVLSKRVIYCYCFSGDVIRDIKLLQQNGSERLPSPTTEIRSPTLDRYKSSVSNNAFVLEKGNAKVTCCFDEDTFLGPTLSLTSYMKNDIFGPHMNRVIGRGTLSKALYGMKQQTSRPKIISTSMALLGGRTATYPEDIMYSVLGILEMEDYKVRYRIGFDEARLGVFEGMKPDVLAIVLGTDWGCSQNSKNNDSALPRVIGSQPTIGVERIEITSSAKYMRDTGTAITSRKERFRLWKDLSRSQSRSTAVVRTLLGSQDSRLMIMFCASLFDDPNYADIPTSNIPEENIRPVIVSGESRLSDEDYANSEVRYDKEVELVELGVCIHYALFADPGDAKYMTQTALLALECEEPSGHLVNRGTVLVLDASAFSGPVSVHTIR
ncbi:hypothetical protein GALMADRAFT_250678 [Galerina marginata CBS 339.88]|uniref:Heterokaryon incompatibility domain-containing protein n=1 Tax=Galerina marginata (strain CBS 339.88) TaxID=685588 RepID=A0A067SSR8_GALM3|nr:hypothetical protein GALMADRAFT_250678 [Galerina marginata CBS 339.88]